MEGDQQSFADKILDQYLNRYFTSLSEEERCVDDNLYEQNLAKLFNLMNKFAKWNVPGMDYQGLMTIYSLRVYWDMAKNKRNMFRPIHNYYKPVFRSLNYEINRTYERWIKKHGEDSMTKLADYPIEILASETEFVEIDVPDSDFPQIVTTAARFFELGDDSLNEIAKLSILACENGRERFQSRGLSGFRGEAI